MSNNTPFPEYGTEDEKNQWAADEIWEGEGGQLCPVCGNRQEEIHAGYWWCRICDDDPDIYYGEEDDYEEYDPLENPCHDWQPLWHDGELTCCICAICGEYKIFVAETEESGR